MRGNIFSFRLNLLYRETFFHRIETEEWKTLNGAPKLNRVQVSGGIIELESSQPSKIDLRAKKDAF